jgi:glycosyltransferase involved in cell wall biosynthesis
MQVTASVAPRDGGPSVGALALAKEFHALGVLEQIVSTDADGPTDRVSRSDLPADLPLTLTRVHAPRKVKASRELWSTVRRTLPKVDVVHIHGHYLFSSAATAFLARRAGVPYVVQPHGVLEPYQRQTGQGRKAAFDKVLSRGYLTHAAGVMFATESEALAARDLVPADKAFVISLGASLAAVPAPVPRDPRPTVVFLGRLAAKKRLDLLVTAWAEVVKEIPDAQLLIAGEGDYPVQELIDRLGLTASVRLLGRVSGADKTVLLQNADAFALLSENENFAVSVAESCAAGTPVVVSDKVALHTLIEAHDAGVVVRELAVPAAADALRAMLTDHDRRLRQGKNALQAWETELQWSVTASRLVEVYAFLTGRGPDPRTP